MNGEEVSLYIKVNPGEDLIKKKIVRLFTL